MLTTADIAQVLAHYDLGVLQSTVQVSRGNVNETTFVETSQGWFVVRRNQRHLSEAAQRYRHRLVARLCAASMPTPALMPARNDDTLLELDGRFYEVMAFIKGNDYNPDHPQQIESIGATLARYHQAMDGFLAPPESPQMRYSPQGILALTEMLLERDVMGDLADTLTWYDERAARLRHVLSDQTYDALPHVVIHGDIHRDNMLFDHDEVVALLDYDQAAWDIRIADLADALVSFASVNKPKTISWGVFPGPLDTGRVDLLMRAYGRVAPLTAREVAALPNLLEVIWLQGELARVVSTPEGAPDYHLAVLDQGCQLVTWLDRNRSSLLEHWTKVATSSNERVIAEAA